MCALSMLLEGLCEAMYPNKLLSRHAMREPKISFFDRDCVERAVERDLSETSAFALQGAAP